MNQQRDFVLFGGSGDLAFRKLYPALWGLFRNGEFTAGDRIISVSRRRESDDTFRSRVGDALRASSNATDAVMLDQFLACVFSVDCDITSDEGWGPLRDRLAEESSRLRLFYVATPPSLFVPITEKLAAYDLSSGESRLIVEKPLGSDLKSGRAINAAMLKAFEERRIYRIDHYLGKETVQNLLALRFGNFFLDHLWNSTCIDHVQIAVTETIGVESRGSFYEETGALRDMVQNHMLQMLAFVAMEHPFSLAAEDIRDEKVKVLRALARPEQHEPTRIVAGQYSEGFISGEQVPGYRDEVPDGRAETFVAIRTYVQNQRWSGVPFYLRTGKRMREATATITVQFKPILHSMFSRGNDLPPIPNRLMIKLQPEEWIRLTIATKSRMSEQLELETTSLDLHLDRRKVARGYTAYERLLAAALRGDQTLFVREDEIETSWRWIDSVRDLWGRSGFAVAPYPAGSTGPTKADTLLHMEDREWLAY
ncbi:MAG: glucose-6-phosphate 1-dehydrogenase [Verrucomicrobiaceae bacterium]|nr:glucose-6-phosphate 1-dehydrogenase [Verrucomicrobiaceae bacterium]